MPARGEQGGEPALVAGVGIGAFGEHLDDLTAPGAPGAVVPRVNVRRRQMERRLPALVRPVRIRAATHQREHDVRVRAHRRGHQRRSPVFVLGVHLGPRAQQTRHGGRVAVHARGEERRAPRRRLPRLGVHAPRHVARAAQQEPRARPRARGARGQERGSSGRVRDGRVRSVRDQRGGGFDVAVVARGPQRGAPVSGARVRVGVGAFGEDLDDLAAPAPGGGEQRGLTRDCSRGRRLGVDEDERPFDRGGVRGAGGDVQQRASSSVALVEVPHGLPQGCDAVGVAGTGGQRGSTATTGRGRMRPDLAFPRAFLASAVGRRGGARWILGRRWASRVGRTESINHGAPERSRRHLRSRVSTSPGRAPDVCGARQQTTQTPKKQPARRSGPSEPSGEGQPGCCF